MKTTRSPMAPILVLLCLSTFLMANEIRSEIQLRIHAPFPDLYPNETDCWLVRVENRGNEIIPVPDGSAGLTDEVPPPQFRVQTKTEADAGRSPSASSWEEIRRFADGSMELMRKSFLNPGQAMEAFSWGLPGQPRTPLHGGTFRLAMQVGPVDFVYSNWITITKHVEASPIMRTLHVGDPWGNRSEHQIALSEATHPPYLWFFPTGEANQHSHPSLYRICEVPAGMTPSVQLDPERGQYVVSFPPGGPETVYFAHRCGISKSTPWPAGYQGKDFLLTSYPVSAPSPIGFPMELFGTDSKSRSDHRNESAMESKHPSKRLSEDAADGEGKQDNSSHFILWISLASGVLLVVAVIFRVHRA